MMAEYMIVTAIMLGIGFVGVIVVLVMMSKVLHGVIKRAHFKKRCRSAPTEEQAELLENAYWSNKGADSYEWSVLLRSLTEEYDCKRLGVEKSELERALALEQAVELGIKVNSEERTYLIKEKIELLKRLNKEKATLAREQLLMADLPTTVQTPSEAA